MSEDLGWSRQFTFRLNPRYLTNFGTGGVVAGHLRKKEKLKGITRADFDVQKEALCSTGLAYELF